MKTLLIFIFILISLISSAQETATDNNIGTIKVRKKGVLHSVIYDDVNFRLVCKDIYGNIIDTAVIAFQVDVTVKGIAHSEKTVGPYLSKSLQQKLSRMDGMITLMFSDVMAKEKNGDTISFPDFKVTSGILRENTDY